MRGTSVTIPNVNRTIIRQKERLYAVHIQVVIALTFEHAPTE